MKIDEQSVWEYLKYNIRKFSKIFSKEATRSNKTALETKLNMLESKICFRGNPENIHCKEELDKLYQE